MNTCTIKIPKLKLFGYHGCYKKEKKEGQEFEVNMEIHLSTEGEYIGGNDDLEVTFDYTDIVNKIKEEFNKYRDNLLETLACRLTNVPYMVSADIDRLKHNIPDPAYNIISVKVRIKKYNPEGIDVPYIEVEYVRND